MASIALSPAHAAARALSGVMRAAARNVRWTVLVSILLIFGSFICAAVIQMRLDRMHALDQATAIESRRAQELAADFASALDRYAALGTAFANAEINVETSAALSEAGGPALQNIAVLGGTGALLFEMKRVPKDLLPLSDHSIARALTGRIAFSADSGKSIVLAFAESGRVVLVQLATKELFPRR